MTIFEAHCPTCDGERDCAQHCIIEVAWRSETAYGTFVGQVDHRLLSCRGCQTVFYHQTSWDDDDFDQAMNPATGELEFEYTIKKVTFPAPEPKHDHMPAPQYPEWMPPVQAKDTLLHQCLCEMYEAQQLGMTLLAMVGLRVVLDRATVLLGMDEGDHLDQKIKGLYEAGFIGQTLRDELLVVGEAGNASAHRAWLPESGEFADFLRTVEGFIQGTIVHGKRSLAHAQRIPPRRPRNARGKPVAGKPG